jgi:signal transduction histidine kinase
MKRKEPIQKKLSECEIELDDARGLSSAREQLLRANIKELNEVYETLQEKIRDIREKDERIRGFDEILTRANRLSSLGELAASIAHEIKNPLISIQGFAKRINNADDMEKIQKYAKFIEKESARLAAVLMRLLDFSRTAEPNAEYLDVNEIVDDTILFTEHHLTRFRNVELTVEKSDVLPPAYVDKIHIQQALINILINAAQSMPEGGPIIIRTGKTDGDGRVWISVTDKGAGIDPENLSKIFESFFTTKTKGEGTGLGLSISKRLIEANRGIIEVESSPGEGTTFRLSLPTTN